LWKWAGGLGSIELVDLVLGGWEPIRNQGIKYRMQNMKPHKVGIFGIALPELL